MNGLTDPGVALYIATAVAVIVWIGIWWYLWRIDVQARALRRALEERQQQPTTPSAPILPERRQDERKEQLNG